MKYVIPYRVYELFGGRGYDFIRVFEDEQQTVYTFAPPSGTEYEVTFERERTMTEPPYTGKLVYRVSYNVAPTEDEHGELHFPNGYPVGNTNEGASIINTVGNVVVNFMQNSEQPIGVLVFEAATQPGESIMDESKRLRIFKVLLKKLFPSGTFYRLGSPNQVAFFPEP